jgi:hypothetical protein
MQATSLALEEPESIGMKARGLGFHAVIIGLRPAGTWAYAESMGGNWSIKAFKRWHELFPEKFIIRDAKKKKFQKLANSLE